MQRLGFNGMGYAVLGAFMFSFGLNIFIIPLSFYNGVIGGIVAGSGSWLILRGGSSGGGQDILGLYYTKKFPGFSVGKMSLIVNILVYGICLAMFDIQIVIYKGGNRPGDYGTDRTGRHKLGRRRFLYQ